MDDKQKEALLQAEIDSLRQKLKTNQERLERAVSTLRQQAEGFAIDCLFLEEMADDLESD